MRILCIKHNSKAYSERHSQQPMRKEAFMLWNGTCLPNDCNLVFTKHQAKNFLQKPKTKHFMPGILQPVAKMHTTIKTWFSFHYALCFFCEAFWLNDTVNIPYSQATFWYPNHISFHQLRLIHSQSCFFSKLFTPVVLIKII